MLKAIKDFPQQFAYNPVIKNKAKLKPSKSYILLGMGGSHLGADILNNWDDKLNFILVHSNYGLPALPDKELKQKLIIVSSYSGNTEEPIDGLKQAYQKKLNLLVIATGGKCITLAKRYNIPYIQIPDTGIQPRWALGFNVRAILKAVGANQALKETKLLSTKLKAKKYQAKGKKIAKQLKNKIPIIYASERNFILAYNWKIKFNENAKIPAFYNIFPELNHNEMNGFDVRPSTKHLSKDFYFIFLEDKKDHPRVIKRMKVLSKMYRKRKLPVINIKISGKDKWERIFANSILGDWASYYIAKSYKIDPEPVDMVEEFKKKLK